jgi:hypothetical protein
MNAILLAALLYRATFIAPPKVQLSDIYIQAGFDPKDCHVTDSSWWDMFKPIEAECYDGKKHWAHFDLDMEAF